MSARRRAISQSATERVKLSCWRGARVDVEVSKFVEVRRRSPFVVRRSPFIVRRSSFVVRCSLFVDGDLLLLLGIDVGRWSDVPLLI